MKIISARNLFEILVLVTSTATLALAGCGGGGGGNNVPLTASGATKLAVGNTWTWSVLTTGIFYNGIFTPTLESETQTVTSMLSGIATVADVYTYNSSVVSAGTLTRQIDPATSNLIDKLIAVSGVINPVLPQHTMLPASIGVGSSWTWLAAVSGVQPAAIATVTAINVSRTVPAGTFDNCIQVNIASYVSGTQTISEIYYFSPSVGVSVETHSFVSDPANSIFSTAVWLLQAGYVAN